MNDKLTVIVMTYNQKNYIKQALDSIIAQKTDFDFDILIHDDHSDDGTYEILLEYKNRFPNKIQIIEEETRRFLSEGFNMMIFNHVVPHIKSKYIAYCDGDDYWCDDHKLQKQYDFMNTHPDYSMCFHSAYQLKDNGDMSSKWFIGDDGDLEMSDLINDKPGIHIATSSIFVLSNAFIDFPEWRKCFPVEDIPLYMNAALHGKIRRLKDVMCVYRQFASGSWSSQNKTNKDRIVTHLKETKKATLMFDSQTNKKYHDLVNSQINSCDFRIAVIEKDFKTIFKKNNRHLFKRIPFKERLSLKLQYRFPHLYNCVSKRKK